MNKLKIAYISAAILLGMLLFSNKTINADYGDNFSVDGIRVDSTDKVIVQSSMTINGFLAVGGTMTVAGAMTTTGDQTFDGTIVASTITVSGYVANAGTLSVTGVSVFTGDVSAQVVNATSVTTTGFVAIGGTISVVGGHINSETDDLTIGDGTNDTVFGDDGKITQTAGATLTLQDGSDLLFDANPNAGPFISVTGADSAAGTITFSSIIVTGDVLARTLVVSGSTTITGNISVTTMVVTGDVSMRTLVVGGTTTLNGDITFGAGESVLHSGSAASVTIKDSNAVALANFTGGGVLALAYGIGCATTSITGVATIEEIAVATSTNSGYAVFETTISVAGDSVFEGVMTISSAVISGYMTMTGLTKTQAKATTPTVVGQWYYLSDGSNSINMIISTGTGIGEFDSAGVGGTDWN